MLISRISGGFVNNMDPGKEKPGSFTSRNVCHIKTLKDFSRKQAGILCLPVGFTLVQPDFS